MRHHDCPLPVATRHFADNSCEPFVPTSTSYDSFLIFFFFSSFFPFFSSPHAVPLCEVIYEHLYRNRVVGLGDCCCCCDQSCLFAQASMYTYTGFLVWRHHQAGIPSSSTAVAIFWDLGSFSASGSSSGIQFFALAYQNLIHPYFSNFE